MIKRIVACLVACMLTVGAFCPLVDVHAEQITVDDINEWSPEKYKSFMKLFNLVSQGYEVTFEEGTTSDDIYQEFVDYRYNQLLSNGQATGIESAYQRAALAGSTMTVLQVRMSADDLAYSVNQDYTKVSSTSSGPYDDALIRIADYTNLGLKPDMYIEERGVTCNNGYNIGGNSIICVNNLVDLNGNAWGGFDYFTYINGDYYRTSNSHDFDFGLYTAYENEAGQTIYPWNCSFYTTVPLAILIPTFEEWDNPTGYSHNFNISNDEIRYAWQTNMSIEESGIPSDTQQIVYTWNGGSNQNTVQVAPYALGSYSYGSGNSDVCYSQSTTAGISGFTVTLGSYNEPLTYDEFINGLSGYLRHVDIYVGSSWDTATKLEYGTPGFGITKPSGVVGVQLPIGDNPSIDLFPFIVTVINKIDNSNTSVVINKNDIPDDSYKPDPSGTPVPTQEIPPIDVTPEPGGGDIAIYPPYNPPQNEFPIWGDDEEMPEGLFSQYVGSMYGLTPAPTPQVRGASTELASYSVNGTDYVDNAQDDSATSIATDIVRAGNALLGPITDYIWYVVGFGVIVSLIVKILHN